MHRLGAVKNRASYAERAYKARLPAELTKAA